MAEHGRPARGGDGGTRRRIGGSQSHQPAARSRARDPGALAARQPRDGTRNGRARAWGAAMITQKDIEVVRRLLDEHEQAVAALVQDETEYVARQLGDISRARARRLIYAARQGVATRDLPRRRRR